MVGFTLSLFILGKIHLISVDNVTPKKTVSTYLGTFKVFVEIMPKRVNIKTIGLFPEASKKESEKGESEEKIFILPIKKPITERIPIFLYFDKDKVKLIIKFLKTDKFFLSNSIMICSFLIT